MENPEYFSMVEVAEMLNLQLHHVKYALKAGKVLPPKMVVNGRYLFTEMDIRALAVVLQKPVPARFYHPTDTLRGINRIDRKFLT